MKHALGKYCALICLLLAGCFCGAFAQKTPSSFEGVVTFKKGAGANRPTSTITMSIKGENFLVDEKGEKGDNRIIIDGKKKILYVVLEKEKMVTDVPLEKSSLKSEGKLPAETGKTQKIAGYACKQWMDKTLNGEVELWTNEEMGKLFVPEGPMGAGLIPSPAMQRLIRQGRHFPLLMIERDKSGKEITRLEVTSVEKQPISDAIFTPPADYQKMSMPGSGK